MNDLPSADLGLLPELLPVDLLHLHLRVGLLVHSALGMDRRDE